MSVCLCADLHLQSVLFIPASKCSSPGTSVSALSLILIIIIVKDSEHFFPASAASAFREPFYDLGPGSKREPTCSFFFFLEICKSRQPSRSLMSMHAIPPRLRPPAIIPSPSLIKVPPVSSQLRHNGPVRLQRVKYSISFSVHESLSAGYDQPSSVMNGRRRKWKL